MISPLLANIYLHYAYDIWVNQWRRRHARGEVIVVRCADDSVLGFQRHEDAVAFRQMLEQRVARSGLRLHHEKTRLLRFGRFAIESAQAAGEGKPGSFDDHRFRARRLIRDCGTGDRHRGAGHEQSAAPAETYRSTRQWRQRFVVAHLQHSSLVGFGSVNASLAAFAMISGWITSVGGDNPLISLAVAVNVQAGMTGSASGGMSITLATLGDSSLAMGEAMGVSPELMHRVTSVATGDLDALPHSGAVITLLSICGLTHRQAYLDIAVVAVLVPILSLVFLIMAGTFIGTF